MAHKKPHNGRRKDSEVNSSVPTRDVTQIPEGQSRPLATPESAKTVSEGPSRELATPKSALELPDGPPSTLAPKETVIRLEPRRPSNTPLPPKGIPDARKEDPSIRRHADGTLLRPDDVFNEDLQEATMKDPDELTDAEIVAIERRLREYIAKSGGWRLNLPEEKKTKGKRLLKLLNREDPKWDLGITVPNYLK